MMAIWQKLGSDGFSLYMNTPVGVIILYLAETETSSFVPGVNIEDGKFVNITH